MSRQHPIQLRKLLAGYIRSDIFNASGLSQDITTELTTILSTAGFAAGAIALSPTTDEDTPGVITSSTTNRVEIYDATTNKKLTEISNEIYGRITEAAGVYTLTYYYLLNGVETAHNFTPPTDIKFEFAYRFELHNLPTDIFIRPIADNVESDAQTGAGRLHTEELTVSAPNTLTDLTFTPDILVNVTLIVNAKSHHQAGATPAFTTSGKTVTWNSTNAGYILEVGIDKVMVQYRTLE